MTRCASWRLNITVLSDKLLLIRALRIHSIIAYVQMMHATHHHLTRIAESAAATPT